MNLLTKIRYASRKLRLGIRADDLVLDVGCGQFPNPRADFACDMLPENTERSGDVVVDRPFVWARAEELPFATDAFDFVVLSHVLEHTFEPERLLAEIQRVGRRGYIETPAAWQEFLFPFRFHTSSVDLAEDGALEIRIKREWDDGAAGRAPDVRAGLSRVHKALVQTRPELCVTQLFWTRPIRYRVTRDVPSTWPKGRNRCEDASATPRAYHLLVRTVDAIVRPRRRIDLLKLLACPDCHASLVEVTGAIEKLRCVGCSLEFGKYRGHYNFLEGA
jgi:SAM-dependent methyltransferase